MTNKDIANALTDLTTLMELHGERPYRIQVVRPSSAAN